MWRAVAEPFKNINKIFPTKQKYVGRMIKECEKDKNIRRMIVFGSAILARCNLWSDIDLYFEYDDEPKNFPSIKDYEQVFDKFSNFGVSDEFRDKILKEGVVVYERQPNIS